MMTEMMMMLAKAKMPKMERSRRMTTGSKSTLTVAPRREIEVNWTVGNQEFNAIQFDFHLTNITIWNETSNIVVF